MNVVFFRHRHVYVCSSEQLLLFFLLPAGGTGWTEMQIKTAGSAALQLDIIGWAWFQLLCINDTVCPCALKRDTKNNTI